MYTAVAVAMAVVARLPLPVHVSHHDGRERRNCRPEGCSTLSRRCDKSTRAGASTATGLGNTPKVQPFLPPPPKPGCWTHICTRTYAHMCQLRKWWCINMLEKPMKK